MAWSLARIEADPGRDWSSSALQAAHEQGGGQERRRALAHHPLDQGQLSRPHSPRRLEDGGATSIATAQRRGVALDGPEDEATGAITSQEATEDGIVHRSEGRRASRWTPPESTARRSGCPQRARNRRCRSPRPRSKAISYQGNSSWGVSRRLVLVPDARVEGCQGVEVPVCRPEQHGAGGGVSHRRKWEILQPRERSAAGAWVQERLRKGIHLL